MPKVAVDRLITLAEYDVLKERVRQIVEEGFTASHDDEHADGSLATAAACYAYASVLSRDDALKHADAVYGARTRGFTSIIQTLWPWQPHWFKPRAGRADLVRAAALLIAEIERRDRLEEKHGANNYV